MVAALRQRTVANGCTTAEAREAAAKVAELEARLGQSTAAGGKAVTARASGDVVGARVAAAVDAPWFSSSRPVRHEPTRREGFTVTKQAVDVHQSGDIWALTEGIIAAVRMGAEFHLAPSCRLSPEFRRFLHILVNELLQAGELRDRGGVSISSVRFDGATYTKASLPPAWSVMQFFQPQYRLANF